MKKELIIGVIILILILGIFLINKTFSQKQNEILECNSNQGCVKDSCCHATSCVPKEKAPICEGIYCTSDCSPNTLDCGQGSCECVKNKCEAVLK